MQDMIPPGADRSIRNIPVPANHHRRPPTPPIEHQSPIQEPQKKSKVLWWWITGVLFVCIVFGALLSTVFAGAQVVVYPKTQTITPPSTITAQPSASPGALVYQVMTLTRSATTTASYSGTQQVSTTAMGTIMVYNDYSTKSQPLVATTRFVAPDGKVYRIHMGITIPGATKNASGTLVPGSVSATIYADAPGADYNRSDQVQFTLPGFKNDPQYTKIYGASGGAITGGFVGTEPNVSTSDLAAAQSTLKQQIISNIQAATSSIPPGFIGVSGSLTVQYGQPVATPIDNNQVQFSQNATAIMITVRATDLATALAQQVVPGYTNAAVAFADLSQINVALASSSAKTTAMPLTLALSGSPTLVWQFDQNALKQALLGINKSDFSSTTLTAFEPAIVRAELTLRPFWSTTLPTNPNKISVEIAK